MTDVGDFLAPRLWWGVMLGALVWLWPYASGPLSPVWPNLVAWAAGLVLIGVVLDRAQRGDVVIATGWLMAAAVSALLALLQYFNWDDALFPFVATAVPGFAYANTRQPNHLASLLTVGMLVLVWLQQRREWRLYTGWLGVCMAMGLAATASRGGAVQLLLVGVLTFFWGGNRKRSLMLWYTLVVIAYLAAVLVLPRLLLETTGVDGGRNLMDRMAVESTCSSRKVLWSNVLELIAQYPLTGWGWGELKYGHYMTVYEHPRFCDMLTNAHNLPLQLATELGIPAATVLCLGALGALLWMRPWAETDRSRQLGWGALLLVGVHSMLEFPIWFGNFQVLVALALWLLWPSVRVRFNIPYSSQAPIPLRTRLMVVGLLLALLFGMAWDYVRVSQLYREPADRLSTYQKDTLEKVRRSFFFRDQILFGQVVAAQPDAKNAALVLEAALETLHISPEPRVIERVIVSAHILGRIDLVEIHSERYRRAWPNQFAVWRAAQQGVAVLP